MEFFQNVTTNRIKWGVIWVILASVLLAGCFIPNGPAADPVQLLLLSTGDIAWMLAATGLVLFMTPGLAFFYGGMVQHHSIISTMLQCCICLGFIGILWIIIGFSLAFGEDAGGFIGNPWTYLWFRNVGGAPNPAFAATIPFQLYALFQLKFAVLTPALSAGGFVERIRFGPFLVFVMLYSLIIYCPVAHWVWHPQGFLRVWGVKDFAGGTVVHMTGGVSALAGAVALGPRLAIQRGEEIHPNNVPYIILGTGMLWFGWFGFNGGSELAADQIAVQAFLNTNTASSAAMFMWIVLEGLAGKKPSAVGACVGAVVGLVVITPAAGYVTVGESLFIGGFGAIVCSIAIWLMHKTSIDDGLDAFASHGVGGMLGCILTGVFMANDGVVHGPPGENWKYFGYFWAAIAIVFSYTFVLSWLIFKGINLVTPIRLSRQEEDFGLDETQHGESLYKGAGLDKSVYSATVLKIEDEAKPDDAADIDDVRQAMVNYPIYESDPEPTREYPSQQYPTPYTPSATPNVYPIY